MKFKSILHKFTPHYTCNKSMCNVIYRALDMLWAYIYIYILHNYTYYTRDVYSRANKNQLARFFTFFTKLSFFMCNMCNCVIFQLRVWFGALHERKNMCNIVQFVVYYD